MFLSVVIAVYRSLASFYQQANRMVAFLFWGLDGSALEKGLKFCSLKIVAKIIGNKSVVH